MKLVRFSLIVLMALSGNLPAQAQDYSVAPLPLGFVSVSSNGTNLTSSLSDRDDGLLDLDLPFDFNYFGQPIAAGPARLRLSVNGVLSFDPAAAIPFANTDLGPDSPTNAIFLAWDDLDTSAMGAIITETQGQAPNRQLVIEYSMVPAFENGGTRLDGQIVLEEASGVIRLLYSAANVFGSSVTVGIQSADGLRVRGLPNAASGQATPTQGLLFTPSSTTRDLALTNLTVQAPNDPAQVGDTITLTATLTNLGLQATSAVDVAVLLAPEAQFAPGAQVLATFSAPGSLAPGVSATLSHTLSLPSPSAFVPGRGYALGFQVDPQGTQSDSNSLNDLASQFIRIGPAPYQVLTVPRGGFSSISGLPGSRVVFAPINTSDFDEFTAQIPGGTPFEFRYFGVTIPVGSPVTVSDNGWIALDSTANATHPVNPLLPSLTTPPKLIALAWDDLEGSSGFRIFDRVEGSAPQRVWVVEYSSFEFFGPRVRGRFSAQLRIEEGTGILRFLYQIQSSFDPQSFDLPASLTYGIQDAHLREFIDPTGLGANNTLLPAADLVFLPNSQQNSFVDLACESLNFNPSASSYQLGENVTLSATLRNRGGRDSSSFTPALYLSFDSEITAADLLIAAAPSPIQLDSGQSQTLTLSFVVPALPAGAPGRRVFLGILADPLQAQLDPIPNNDFSSLPILLGPPFYRAYA